MGENNDVEYVPDEDSSLEKFEEELLEEEKKKGRKGTLSSLLFLILIGAGGYYYYITYYLPNNPSAPPPVVAQKPSVPAPQAEEEFVEEEKQELEEAAPEPKQAEEPPKVEQPVKEAPLAEPAPMQEKTAKIDAPRPEAGLEVPASKPEATAKVKSPEMKKPESKPAMMETGANAYTVQAGFFVVPVNAESVMNRLMKLGLNPSSKKVQYKGRSFTVWEGYYKFREPALSMAELLSSQGYKPELVLTGPGNYSLKMGVFNSQSKADKFMESMEDKGFDVRPEGGLQKMEATIVRIEDVRGKGRLNEITEILKKENIDHFVMRR